MGVSIKGLRRLSYIASLTLSISLWGSLAWAGDPFRVNNPRDIGDNTEAAFNEIFRNGNYTEAKTYLEQATDSEPDEPLAYAMKASLAYAEENFDEMKTYAVKTQKKAEKLKSDDALRGNLYLAVGHFLEGAYLFKKQGPLSAVKKLQIVLAYVEKAEAIDANDPEFNLLKGYLDLILAVNLPFASPDQAIDKFEKYAAPQFMVDRAIATAYRDLDEYDQAIQFMDKALKATPENPEVQYLKGQILRKKARSLDDSEPLKVQLLKEAFTYFEVAKAKEGQLPKTLLIPLNHDHRAVQDEIKTLEAYSSEQ
ncbi:MAG: Sll0314/Alr1548 family TPR repeat-containing protein [Microcystaceae cyanobacterium]